MIFSGLSGIASGLTGEVGNADLSQPIPCGTPHSGAVARRTNETADRLSAWLLIIENENQPVATTNSSALLASATRRSREPQRMSQHA